MPVNLVLLAAGLPIMYLPIALQKYLQRPSHSWHEAELRSPRRPRDVELTLLSPRAQDLAENFDTEDLNSNSPVAARVVRTDALSRRRSPAIEAQRHVKPYAFTELQ